MYPHKLSFKIISLLLIILISVAATGKISKVDTLISSLNLNKTSRQDIEAAFQLIAAEDVESNLKDSLLSLANEKAMMSGDDDVLMTFYIYFFRLDSAYTNTQSSIYAQQMQKVARQSNRTEWLYESYAVLANIQLLKYQFDEALENAEKAFYYANQTEMPALQVKSMLVLGVCFEKKNRKIDAFRSYMDASYRAEHLKDNKLLYQCYEHLSYFFLLISNYEKAKQYKIKQINIVSTEADSVKLMRRNIELASILYLNDEDLAADRLLQRVLNFNTRRNNSQLRRDAFVVYRSALITKGRLKELSDLYTKKYPQELNRMQREDTAQYFRLLAFIYETKDSYDSAEYFYQIAEQRILVKSKEPYMLSTFYKRYGQFLLRKKDMVAAEQKLESAYLYAEKVKYLPFMIETASLLDSTNALLGRMDKAYEYSRLTKELIDKLHAVTKEEDLLLLEIDTETKRRDLAIQEEQEKTRRRHNLQYTGITLCIITSFVILAMFGFFKVNKWLIKGTGFFAFIFFFEFIVLLADHQIHHVTHGEPWKIMALKILLIGILLPLHHWLEHKVVNYLSHHELIDTSKLSWKWLKRKPKNAIAETVDEK